jgi:histidine triad (HIT) family protein
MSSVPRGLFDSQGRKRDWYCEDVLSGKLPVRVIYEDERVLAVHHPYPEAEIHAVVIPKSHVDSLIAPEFRDPDLLVSMVTAVQRVARELGLDRSGFRIVANAVAPGVTPHVHWHVMGLGVPPPKPTGGAETNANGRRRPAL